MPTWQGEEFLERVLAALSVQRVALPWDFLAVDSGSTDGTLAVLERWSARFPVPLRVRSIHQSEFDHGDTRNLLAAWSTGDLLVFLTQDAIPAGADWLARLLSAFDDPEVGAAYCRNAPRPDARPATAVLSAEDPGYAWESRTVRLPPAAVYERLSAHDKRLLYNFNDVASAVRRVLWERHPFPRAPFGEDVLMARALLEAGHTIRYVHDAPVEHSHDYDARETYARAFVDGVFNAEWLDRICVGSERDAKSLARRHREPDATAVARLGLPEREAEETLRELAARRDAAFLGLCEGGRATRRRASTGLLERTNLRILMVVHGFPPDTWAGTEVYTLELAKALVARGHRVTVLTRAPADSPAATGGPPDFSVTESEFQGLRVLRMVHRLEHGSLAMSYRQPRAEAAFREVLLAERPDLVHFQHLIHLSAGLVHVAKELGAATVMHCHDYWALCARVQLIRPDGQRCEGNQGTGCLLCVKERHLDRIPVAKRLGERFEPLLDAAARHVLGRPAGGPMRAELSAWRDLHARQPYVLDAYAAADLRISPSRFLRAKLLESGAFDPHTFLYSDNGLRTDHVRALNKAPDPKGRLRIGFVGSLVWYKGGAVLMEAMALLRGQNAVLHVHGAFDPKRDEHHLELQRLGQAAGNVVFHGRFDNARLAEVYAEIDVLVVPSVWFENSPITIHEAHMTGTPVVASDIGGMAEYVRDGVDGLHFRVGEAKDLARVLGRFLREPELLAQLSQDFPRIKTVEENAAEMEFRYRALVARRRSRHAATLIDRRGHETLRRDGGAEQQGAEYLLLRPGAAAEYDVHLAAGGPREYVLEILALAGEPTLELGGAVYLGDRWLGALEPFAANGRDELRRFRFEAHHDEGVRRLRVEARLEDGSKPHLRIARLVVREVSADTTNHEAHP